MVYLALGEEDTLLARLDRANERLSDQVILARLNPRLDSVRDDESLKASIERLGLCGYYGVFGPGGGGVV